MKLPVDTLSVKSSDEVAEALKLVEADVKAISKTTTVEYVADLAEAFEDKTEDIQIQVKMDEEAVFRTELVQNSSQ